MNVEEEADTMVDEDLRKMARDISQKHTAGSNCVHDEDFDKEEEGDDGDGYVFEDLDEIAPVPGRKSGKVRVLPSWVLCIGRLQRWMSYIKTDMPWTSLR